MRKLLLTLLLAGAAATPAVAGPHDWSDRQSAHEDRQSAREDRQSAREDRQSARQESSESRQQSRGDRSEAYRPQFSAPGNFAPQGRPQQPAFAGGGGERANGRPDRGNFDGRFAGANGAVNYVAPGPRMVEAPRAQGRADLRQQRVNQRDLRQQGFRDARELRQSSRPLPNVMRDRHPLVVSNTPRPGTQPPLRSDGYHNQTHWDTNWRHNGRYDWQNYRRHHHSIFHLGFYYDPYGWGYQPFSIGWRLWSGYYGQRYWINNPWMYRLPYAPPGYVWVRYWNDALLVDTFTGTVVDMIPGFFW